MRFAASGRRDSRLGTCFPRNPNPGRQVLPEDLNRLLIIVVVLSMALTPALAELGKRFAERTDSMPLPGGGGTGAAPCQHDCGHASRMFSRVLETCWC